MSRERVLVRREGGVGVMTFNCQEQMNTLEPAMLLAMEQALQELENDAQVRVILITGGDSHVFIAGGNIADLNQRDALTHYRDFSVLVHRVFRRFEECTKPTIAAVNGWALGGGTEFLLTTDVRLMADDAQLGLPEIKLGLFPGGGGSQRLMRQIAPCQAKLLMYTGDFISSQEALRMGLVNRTVPREHLQSEAMALAKRIAEKSPWALRLLKSAMTQGAEMPLNAALQHEAVTISLLLDTADAHEGCQAFLEKREPQFQGK
ncbi:MAG: enoyl-CoA hydratase/isomerase family protein [Comamonas sp.]